MTYTKNINRLGFNKTHITRERILNTYFENNNVNDVIKLIVTAEHITTQYNDTWVQNIVEHCLYKDPNELEKILQNYIYNK